jgi:hypothetical protein
MQKIIKSKLLKPSPELREHKLGTLFGADLVLKTNDPKIIDLASEFLKKATKLPETNFEKRFNELLGPINY